MEISPAWMETIGYGLVAILSGVGTAVKVCKPKKNGNGNGAKPVPPQCTKHETRLIAIEKGFEGHIEASNSFRDSVGTKIDLVKNEVGHLGTNIDRLIDSNTKVNDRIDKFLVLK